MVQVQDDLASAVLRNGFDDDGEIWVNGRLVLQDTDGMTRDTGPIDTGSRRPCSMNSIPCSTRAWRAGPSRQRGLGPVMAAVFERIKRQEIARHAAADDKLQWERREYFSRY